MGNNGLFSNKQNDLSHIKTEGAYLNVIMSHLNRVQEKLYLLSRKKKIKSKKDSIFIKPNNNNENHQSYENERFYILFANTLLQMKILMEEYYSHKLTNLNETNSRFQNKIFDFDKAIPFLENLLDTENKGDIKTLKNYNENKIFEKMFTNANEKQPKREKVKLLKGIDKKPSESVKDDSTII
jgi:hypothetical protein